VESLDPTRTVEKLGRRIAELRAKSDLTQDQFAEKLSVSVKYLQRVEAGEENLTVHSLVRFANALGVRLTALFVAPRRTVQRPGRPRRVSRTKPSTR
jgi:transcriptional regulator with XRE-family HTH domain